MRMFGTADLREALLDYFAGMERIDLCHMLTPDQLAEAAVPISSLTRDTGHSVFFFRKPA